MMLKKGEHVEGTPVELRVLLDQDEEANAFFESLSKSYKAGLLRLGWFRQAGRNPEGQG